MPKARILLVNVGTALGGAEAYIERLTALLSDHAELFALCANARLAQRLQESGVTVFVMPLMESRRIFRYTKYLEIALLMPYLLVRYQIPIAHFNGYQTSFLLAATRILGVFTIITPHHLPRQPWLQAWYKLTARAANFAVNVSETVNREHRKLLPSVRTAVIPNWIPELPDFTDARLPVANKQLLFVGRLVGNKGLPILLESIREFGGGVRLLVSGQGPLRDSLETQTRDLPVEFLGYAPDLSRLYAQVDALVVPSLGPEGSCLVALEAMAHGLPCIMSDLPVFKEIADDGRAALIFRAGDSRDLSKIIRYLYSNSAEVTCVRRHARKLIEQFYSVTAVRGKYMSLFSDAKVVTGGRSTPASEE